MKPTPTIALCALLALTPAMSTLAHDHKDHKHHHAHVHGVAKLEVAVDGGNVDLRLESPLDNLLGFERAPRNDKERAAVATMRARLNQGETLFAPTAAARCRQVSARVDAPTLDGKAAGEHADLVAEYRFECAEPARLTGLEVRLADHFKGMRRIDAQVIGPKGQTASRITAKMRFLSW
jgi:hypothetical protein